MNNLQNAGLSALILEIESDLEKADAARSQLEDEVTGNRRRSGGLEIPREALRGYIESAAARLSVVLDIGGMSGSHAQLAERWKDFSKKRDGVGDTHFHPDVDWLECPALSYLQSLTSAISAARGKDVDLMERYELNKLELLLEKLPQMLLTEGVVPQSEKDVRDVAHKYLEIYFTQYTRDVQIPGPIRPFKPDAGIMNLKVAIEFKFATDRSEINREIGELFEDTSGYANSLDWRRFYCVVYQTQALISKDQLKAELDKASRKTWTPILVSATGNRKTKKIGKAVRKPATSRRARPKPST
ncbi:MAG: hypothetical protein ACHP8B_00880 [Terriglobales bacterium]